jgi:hypothetical protein
MTGANHSFVRKVVNGMSHRISWRIVGALLLLPVLAGCGHKVGTEPINLRPQVELSNAPPEGTEEFYSVRINWFASDPDGQVVRFIYATDPPVQGDTTWVETRSSEITVFFRSPGPNDPLPPVGQVIISRGYHTFVVKAIDNEGAPSAPATRSFTSRTTAPSTVIQAPRPTHQQPVSTTPSVTISWLGQDPDGVISQKPIKYKFKLVSSDIINPANPQGVTQQQVQDYFGADAVNFFATWDSVPGDTTFKFYEGLTPQTIYFFAVVAFDEAGAFEPRFNLDSNVLQFRPTLAKLGPDITVFNEFFARTQSTGGISIVSSRIYTLEFPADQPIKFNWFAVADVGAIVTGYRWALDIEGQDISNETPRTDDSDFKHWSAYSLNETSTIIGPFAGSLDSTITHFFYLEARDNLGFVSLFTIRLRIVKPRFDLSLLVVDDMYGTLTGKTAAGRVPLLNPYPMEAEQDSFHFAVGGFPDSMRILGDPGGDPNAISRPGMFSGFDYDTLDYKFYPNESILLEKLSRYRVVAWYTDNSSAGRTGSKFGSTNPRTGIRLLNTINQLNTFAVYLKQDGKAWLFGDGITTAIANGYYSRISISSSPRIPYTSGDDARNDILREGNFLYDFPHLRSQLNTAGTVLNSFLTINQQMQACIPYLPEFATVPYGSPPPPDRSLDPRVGPSSERNLPRWAGLPRLTLTDYRSANVNPAQRSINLTWIIDQPLFVTEGTGAGFHSTLDTLYLCQAKVYDPNHVQTPPSDGFPNAIDYHGEDNGEVVWFGFPMYFFDLDKARTVAGIVLRNLGEVPSTAPNPGAHAFVSSDAPREIDWGATIDERRKSR